MTSGLFLVLACGPGEVVEDHAILPPVSLAAEQEPPALNGCLEGAFVASRDALVVIRFGLELGHNYSPACLRVVAGTRVRFEGPMGAHPVEPGRIVDSMPVDADGPVPAMASGESAEFVAGEAGRFGYFCDLHVAEGMMGALEVVAAPVSVVAR